MIDDSNKKDEAFIRQRRNLIIISLILVSFITLQFTIKEVNILGIKADINDPSNVIKIIWVLWIYFMLRYFQVWPSDGFSYIYNLNLNNQWTKLAKENFLSEMESKYLREVDITNIKIDYISDIQNKNRKFVACGEVKILGVDEPVRINDHIIFVELTKYNYRRILIMIEVSFRTTAFTEYQLPFVIGMLPVVFSIF